MNRQSASQPPPSPPAGIFDCGRWVRGLSGGGGPPGSFALVRCVIHSDVVEIDLGAVKIDANYQREYLRRASLLDCDGNLWMVRTYGS